ncbi:spore germination protein [Virgibacillus halophilus]|uniref:Spore germination protein n=1 Tax=Tigheibacillus halophilus TaxID=361280 RepID=A0ABU5C9M8_9BACI|nr:spore germination protein [Virgibacillus halophilus]
MTFHYQGGNSIDSLEKTLEQLIFGSVCLYIEGEKEILTYSLLNKEKRSLETAETESLVLGPKMAFTESIETNLNIVRFRIRSTDLAIEEFQIGTMSPRIVRMVYMKSIANETDVNTMRQRLEDLDVDEIQDSVVLKQYLEDSQWSIFPQFDSTELPDRFTYNITKGKIGVLTENSPTGFIGPSTLFSFFESTEDLYMRWNAGTALRMLRFIAMTISILLTPLYVAAVTYQYSIIPSQELITLGESRASVPFPPLLEALILEFMIELLREAGARLPTKVGQTMGIVGGIVIGEAAVQAGLTSNILIILVAISALASFTSPSYLMSVTIRMVRFPLILLSGLLGLLGIVYGVVFLIIHLLKVTSLGRPFLVPLYPLQLKDFNKVLFRSPF